MRSRLKPDTATMVGLLTAGGVFLVYNDAVPSIVDLRATEPHDHDAEQARKQAAWVSAALVAGVFLIARDFNSFIISGGALVAIDAWHKHANGVSPATGKLDVDNGADSIASVTPLPDYSETV